MEVWNCVQQCLCVYVINDAVDEYVVKAFLCANISFDDTMAGELAIH